MKFSSSYFPKFDELTTVEQIFMRWCCYFPPKARREKTRESLSKLEVFEKRFEDGFTPRIWEICKNQVVLDFGCGEGGYVLALAQKGAGSVVGLDINDSFDNAKNEATRLDLAQVTFVQGSSKILSDETFDVVISHDSFEHFEDPGFILKEMVRVTKPGGLILIKFGPPWKNPWGRHMSGTIRKDRPWIHLLVPEKVIMHVHSVYHNEETIKEKFAELGGGLNKMTLRHFKQLIVEQSDVHLLDYQTTPVIKSEVVRLSIIEEFFVSSVKAIIQKNA